MHIKNFDPYDFSKKEVGGVPIYYKNLPWAPCIHIQIVFKAGAFSDPKGKEGVAHFLEHLIGNGSPLLPNKKAMKEFSRTYMLDSRNAFTGHYRTAYVGKCLPENFKTVLEAMRDYVFNPFIKPEDVEHERKVITQEAWGRYKNDKYLKYVKEFADNIYQNHERSRISSPLGWPETVATISREDIADFHKKYYVKENLSVFVVGSVNEEDIDLFNNFVLGIPSGQENIISVGEISAPKISRFEKNSEDIGDPIEQMEFSLTRVLSSFNEKENIVGEQSEYFLYDLFFERLRLENSLCYGISVNRARFKDYQEFTLSVKTKEENLAIVENEVQNVVKEILEDKWEDRFKSMQKMMIDQVKSSERLSNAIINNASEVLSVADKLVSLSDIVILSEQVKYEDVKKYVTELFDPKWVFTEVIYPAKK